MKNLKDYKEVITKQAKISACNHEKDLFTHEKRDVIVNKICKYLKTRLDDFDAIVVSGYSMALISPIIAHKLKKEIVLVRKESEKRYSSFNVEGIHNQRCIMIDDLIASGKTIEHIRENIGLIDGTLVGFVLYNNGMSPPYKGIPCWKSL